MFMLKENLSHLVLEANGEHGGALYTKKKKGVLLKPICINGP
jgi:hypothetical protein